MAAIFEELVKQWEDAASLVATRPTSTAETRAQATGWKQCAAELKVALAEAQQFTNSRYSEVATVGVSESFVGGYQHGVNDMRWAILGQPEVKHGE